jgi:hypothetical protein
MDVPVKVAGIMTANGTRFRSNETVADTVAPLAIVVVSANNPLAKFQLL